MIYEHSSYSKYLKALLFERQSLNKAYSLRAMAQNIGVSASTLSDVINGRKNFSEEMAQTVASKLKLSGRKTKYFMALVQYETTKNEELKLLLLNQLRVLNPKLREHFDFNMDQFRFMSDWYHMAILEMTYLPQQSFKPEDLAKSLGITETQAKEALVLLQRLELLEPTDSGSYQKTKKQFKFQSSTANLALRKFYHQMLGKAQESLHTQTPQEKMIGTETLPLNVEDLPAAKDIIEFCFQQMLELSKRSQNRTHVYHLGIQFFQLNSRGNKEVEK